ncbi:MAG: hypothetical protein WDW19_04720 [Neisseriaceae bacterium]
MGIYDFFIRTSRQISVAYLSRQYLVAVFFCLVFGYMDYHSLLMARNNPALAVFVVGCFLLNTLLFPFAKYALDSIVGYVISGNRLEAPLVLRWLVLGLYLAVCWAYAIILAPVGIMMYVLIKMKKAGDRRYYY